MKPIAYIHVFAGISITALCLQIFNDFWLPLVIGVLAMLVTAVILRK
jgi:hypothetical protein